MCAPQRWEKGRLGVHAQAPVVRGCRAGTRRARGSKSCRLATLRLTAGEAGHTTVHHDDGRDAAPHAELRPFRLAPVGERVLLAIALLPLATFLLDQLAARCVHLAGRP